MRRTKFISGVEYRSSAFLPQFYVSRCGTKIWNSNVPYLVKHVLKSEYGDVKYHHLTPFKSLHQAVAHAWVFNPCPSYYTIVDHINGDTHDNRAENLRFLTQALNMSNLRYGTGISYVKRYKKWQARVTLAGSVFKQGVFKTKTEAEDKAALWRDEKFHQQYKENVVRQMEVLPDYKRPAGLLYWRDHVGGTTTRTPSYLS